MRNVRKVEFILVCWLNILSYLNQARPETYSNLLVQRTVGQTLNKKASLAANHVFMSAGVGEGDDELQTQTAISPAPPLTPRSPAPDALPSRSSSFPLLCLQNKQESWLWFYADWKEKFTSIKKHPFENVLYIGQQIWKGSKEILFNRHIGACTQHRTHSDIFLSALNHC